uniref:50S ribosomal protein L11 n=1 Tax=Podoviridae sp. ctLPy3 TaxID=2825244 RepID=A0A8S5UWK3_9CAUD|nr:MAG TPA: 50S ribosomal protein L11 [Podoviridae sp. ctLPy3]
MKKITCIQQYVIDNLIEDEILSTNSLLGAISKVCSKEQFDNILSILIETPIPCTNIPELDRKEDSENETNLVRMSMFIPEKASAKAKIEIIKILKEQFNFSLNQTKEYVDSCIGKYSTLPNIILQTEVDEVTKKLEPYNVIVSTAAFY